MTGEEFHKQAVDRLIREGLQAQKFGLNGKLIHIRETIRLLNNVAGITNWNKNHECDPFCEICKLHPDEEPYYAEDNIYQHTHSND